MIKKLIIKKLNLEYKPMLSNIIPFYIFLMLIDHLEIDSRIYL